MIAGEDYLREGSIGEDSNDVVDDDEGIGGSSCRPRHIGALLDKINDRFGTGEDLYASFIELASIQTKEEANVGAVKIKTALKFYNKSMSDGMEIFDGDKNSSLVRIFMFYAAMQNSAAAMTFSATAVENETMSFFELDKLARDFDIVPRLLTKYELKDIWDDFVYIQSIRTKEKPISALNFENFQDIMVRMALYAYNKPGMKKMVLAVNGFFPSPEEIVAFFCQQLNLSDFAGVKAHIMNRGRETQGALNYRSLSETNWRAKEELRIDLRARHLARVTAHEAKQKEKLKTSKTRESEKATGGKKRTQQVQYGLWSALAGDNYDLDARVKYERRQIERESVELPGHITDMLEGKTTGLPESSDLASSSMATSEHSMSRASSVDGEGDNVTTQGKNQEEEEGGAEDDDDQPKTFDKAMEVARKRGTKLPLLRDQYTDSLIYVLNPYSLREPEKVKPNLIESGGCFLDCGSLHPETRCVVTLDVTNLMLDIVRMDVQAIGFPDEDCEIVTYAKPVVSGMTRKISIKFNVGRTEGCMLSSIVVALLTNRARVEMKIPVFFRVDHSTVPRVVANIRTLSSLAHKYNGKYKPPSTSFEKQKDEDFNLWIKPEETAQARRSTHDRPKSREQRKTLFKRAQSLKRLEEKQALKSDREPTSKELLAAALSDYLPKAGNSITDNPTRETMMSGSGVLATSDALASPPSRPRSRTSFFAEGMSVNLHAPKHLQTKLQTIT